MPSLQFLRSALPCAVLAVLTPPAHAIDTILVASNPPAPATALVPSVANGGSTLALPDWTLPADPPNAASWISGTLAMGYEASPGSSTSYSALIGLNLAQMQNNNASAYLRVPFTVDAATLNSTRALALDINYDDGFIAYLNGVEIASRNPPTTAPGFQSGAGGDNPDQSALDGERIDVTAFLPALMAGANMLAIHGLNNGSNSSDFLILPSLIASDVPPPVWPDLQIGPPVITGLVSPVDIQHSGDGTGRLFIVERAGRIRIWDGAALSTFLDIRSAVNTSDSGGDEQGLLGLTFPPDYTTKQHFYVNYISNAAGRSGDTVVARFAVNPADPDDALEASQEIILVVDQPESNHNGGQMHFGSDGYLYLGFGDGGGGGDNHGSIGNGQDPNTLLGKMLRLDVEGPAGPGLAYAIPLDNPFVGDAQTRDEIWSFGLRNPWRWSFDRRTGDLFIADVGQSTREEVSYAPAASGGGKNFQWRQLEGFSTHSASTPLTKGTSTDPIFDYPRGLGSSITGGYVYRGSRFPRMDGIYFCGDYNSGRIWGLQKDSTGAWASREFLDTTLRISTFGEDEAGEVYVASLFTGEIHHLTDTQDDRYFRIVEASFDAGGAVQATFGAEIGRRYQLQFSIDLQDWSDLGAPQSATGFTLTLTGGLTPPLPERGFLRVAELAN